MDIPPFTHHNILIYILVAVQGTQNINIEMNYPDYDSLSLLKLC